MADNNVVEPENQSQPIQEGSLESAPIDTRPLDQDNRDLTGGNTPSSKGNKKHLRLLPHVNLYILSFVVLVLAMGAMWLYLSYRGNRANKFAQVDTTSLDAASLSQISGSETTLGNENQVLKIQSNTVFDGKVLVKQGLDISGPLTVGNTLDIAGLSVSGNTTLGQATVTSLSVTGGANVQGTLSAQNGLAVVGDATVGGTLAGKTASFDSLTLNQDLLVNRHINPGGSSPSISSGGAIGSGGTVSISGNDTTGTIVINTGGAAGAGTLATVGFVTSFSGTPHVILSPASQSAGSTSYYVTRSTSGFVVAAASAAPSNSTLIFDYIVLD